MRFFVVAGAESKNGIADQMETHVVSGSRLVAMRASWKLSLDSRLGTTTCTYDGASNVGTVT
jgi:hypothetical protein